MLKAEQVKQAVELYLKRSYTQCAVLIDGGWGVGKTYLLEQYILPQLEDVRCFHISLYGLSTISDIENEIFKCACLNEDLSNPVFSDEEYFSADMFKGARLGGVSYAVQFLVNKYHAFSSEASSFKLVLCFDDIERWAGNLNVCLSYINKIVEQEKLKCILLGNLDALDDSGLKDIARAREKTIRHIYKFENPPDTIINIAMSLVDYQSDSSRVFVQAMVEDNMDQLVELLRKVKEKNIRTLSEALQLYEYIYSKNQEVFNDAKKLAVTYFITLLSTLILLKKHFLHKKEKTELLDGDYRLNNGISLLKKIGYFDKSAPEHITEESKILLDHIFYRLEEIQLKGVFSIIENGFYIDKDFEDSFSNWKTSKYYEKYLDKYNYYQLDEAKARKIFDRIMDTIFEDQSITNPATLLLLSERVLSDIHKDIVEMDFAATKSRFAEIILTLYETGEMDVMDLEYLESQVERYPNSEELLKLTLNLNSEYVKAALLAEHESFWHKLSKTPEKFNELLEQSDIYALLKTTDSSRSVMELLENLSNSERYLLAERMKERIISFSHLESIKTYSQTADMISQEINKKYENEYGIRASHMKQIADIFGYINDPS